MPLDVLAGSRSQALILALGKDRRAYLLDRNNLGGIGGQLHAETVSERPIRTSPAIYPGNDDIYVAFQGEGTHCPTASRDNGLVVLKIGSGSPPFMATAWCGMLRGAGSPMVTTTDGHSNPIVWIVSAEGDNRLHGFRGDTGEPIFTSGEVMNGLRHFQTLIAAKTTSMWLPTSASMLSVFDVCSSVNLSDAITRLPTSVDDSRIARNRWSARLRASDARNYSLVQKNIRPSKFQHGQVARKASRAKELDARCLSLCAIAQKGPAGFIFPEAARWAGVSPAAPYRHFRDREELLAIVALRGFERFTIVLERAWDDGRPQPLTALDRLGKAHLEFARTEPA